MTDDNTFIYNIISNIFKDYTISIETALYQICKQTNSINNLHNPDILNLSMQFIGDLLNELYHNIHKKDSDDEIVNDYYEIRDRIFVHSVCFIRKLSYMFLSIYLEFNKNRNILLVETSYDNCDLKKYNQEYPDLPNEFYHKINITNDNIPFENMLYHKYIESVECNIHIIINQFKQDIINSLTECDDNCKIEYDPNIHPLKLVLEKIENK